MDLVGDTSSIIAVIADEPEKAEIIRKTRGAVLHAPLSVHWEIGNAFSAMMKRKRVTLEQAHRAISVYETLPIRWVDVPLDEALKLCDSLGIYAYDAYLLVCARELHCPLITLDKGSIHAAKSIRIPVVEVVP